MAQWTKAYTPPANINNGNQFATNDVFDENSMNGFINNTFYNKDTIDAHIVDKTNPHLVTKAQVGLGNCDNTSDLDKPISIATQNAINEVKDNVQQIKTILEQSVVTVGEMEDKFTTRETADGANIYDGVETNVLSIAGDTVKCENLIPFPYYDKSKTVGGMSFSLNGDRSVTVNGTNSGTSSYFRLSNNLIFSKATSYTLSCYVRGGRVTTGLVRAILQQYTMSGYWVKNFDADNGRVTFELTQEDLSYKYILNIIATSNAEVRNLNLVCMLNEGSTALPYQPYFNDLKNANFKEIVSTGKNLIDYTKAYKPVNVSNIEIIDNGVKWSGTYFFPIPVKLQKNTAYTMSYVSEDFGTWRYAYTDGTYSTETLNGFSRMTDANKMVRDIYIYKSNASTAKNDMVFTNIMLNLGNTVLPYEPYKSDSISLETAIELGKWDKAIPSENKIIRYTKTIVFNGTENWQKNDGVNKYFVSLPNLLANSSCISNAGGANSVVEAEGNYYCGGNFNVWTTLFNDITSWKSHLAELYANGTPLMVSYQLETPTEETVTFPKTSYKAWKNGSETINQGEIDNSQYGAENTITQEYLTKTGV